MWYSALWSSTTNANPSGEDVIKSFWSQGLFVPVGAHSGSGYPAEGNWTSAQPLMGRLCTSLCQEQRSVVPAATGTLPGTQAPWGLARAGRLWGVTRSAPCFLPSFQHCQLSSWVQSVNRPVHWLCVETNLYLVITFMLIWQILDF